MPSKTKDPLSAKELAKFEASRDLGAELLQSIREMKAGKIRVAYSPATEAREKTGLSQSQFAAQRSSAHAASSQHREAERSMLPRQPGTHECLGHRHARIAVGEDGDAVPRLQ